MTLARPRFYATELPITVLSALNTAPLDADELRDDPMLEALDVSDDSSENFLPERYYF